MCAMMSEARVMLRGMMSELQYKGHGMLDAILLCCVTAVVLG